MWRTARERIASLVIPCRQQARSQATKILTWPPTFQIGTATIRKEDRYQLRGCHVDTIFHTTETSIRRRSIPITAPPAMITVAATGEMFKNQGGLR